jgi:DNA-binding transcriptional LysR family regulator
MSKLSGIEIFVQVAETRSFSETAKQLGVSSSAVGKSIARLESRLSAQLFYRSTRSMTLTTEAHSTSNAAAAFWPRLKARSLN